MVKNLEHSTKHISEQCSPRVAIMLLITSSWTAPKKTVKLCSFAVYIDEHVSEREKRKD